MKFLILAALTLLPAFARAEGECTIGEITRACEFYNHETWTQFTYACVMYQGFPTLMPTCHTSYVAPSEECSGTVLESSCK